MAGQLTNQRRCSVRLNPMNWVDLAVGASCCGISVTATYFVAGRAQAWQLVHKEGVATGWICIWDAHIFCPNLDGCIWSEHDYYSIDCGSTFNSNTLSGGFSIWSTRPNKGRCGRSPARSDYRFLLGRVAIGTSFAAATLSPPRVLPTSTWHPSASAPKGCRCNLPGRA